MSGTPYRRTTRDFWGRALRLATTATLLAGTSCSAASHAAAPHGGTPASATSPTAARAVTTVTSPTPLAWRTIGHSVEGRPLRVRRVGHGPRTALWIGGIHGDEPQGIVATASLAAAFDAAGLGDRVTLTILEDDNPDRRALHTRENANHVDLNRNFPSRNFDTANPEYLVITCHAFRGHQFINYDGPGKAIAARFSELSGFRVERSDELGFRTPGSLGSLVGVDRGKPILTIEFLRDRDPTVDWKQIKQAALSVIGS